MHARHGLDQGRLAAAVLADEAMDLAGPHVPVDGFEGQDAAEALGDAVQAEEGGRRHWVHKGWNEDG